MSAPRIYLDHNATTPPDERVVDAVVGALRAGYANPSSIHRDGRRARAAVEKARRSVAGALAADPHEIVFTASGTEADAIGIVGLVRALADRYRDQPPLILSSQIEHPAALGAIAGLGRGDLIDSAVEVRTIAVTPEGRVDVDALRAALDRPALIVTHLANHEIGVVQAVREMATIARERNSLIHCDAVQAVGKLAVDVASLGVDSLAMSGHKMGGPLGVGALWLRPGIDSGAVVEGGSQERGRRPGTENVPAIVGLGVAAECMDERRDAMKQVSPLMAVLEDAVSNIDGARVNGAREHQVGNTLSVRFDGVPGDVVVQALDLAGISVSTGAACSSGTSAPSPVLIGLGLTDDEARGGVRFSMGPKTTADEVAIAAEKLAAAVARARDFS